MRANAIRCLQTGHIGRSVKDAVITTKSYAFPSGNLLDLRFWRLPDTHSLREAIKFDETSFRIMPKAASRLLPSAQETSR